MIIKRSSYFILFVSFVLFNSCKKDVLHPRSVQQLDSKTTTDRLSRIFFINNNVGFVVGGQRFYACNITTTTDGGYTWNKMTLNGVNKCLYGISMSPSGTLYSVGFDGKIVSSNDMGKTWNYSQSWYLPFSDIAFFTPGSGTIVGGISFNEGYRLIIDDKGNTIKKDSLGYQLNRVVAVNDKVGYICGFGVLQKTTDAGQTWNFLNIEANDNFTGINIHDENDIWVCGYGGGVYHTIDGGASWFTVRNNNDITLPRYYLLDILFQKDNIHGWAVGENGLLLYTDDAGHHWEEYERFTDNALRSLAMCANGDLIVAGDNGALYRLQL